MKILKIEDKKAMYLSKDSDFKDISEITKDDIYFLLDKAFTVEVKMDICEGEEIEISNPADKIIYSTLYTKLYKFIEDKSKISAEIDSKFEKLKEVFKKELD